MDAAVSPDDLKAALRSAEPPLVIDVRKSPAYSSAASTIAGALRRDPDRVSGWAAELPRAATVVVYCVHGHQVSQNAARALNEAGVRARYLEGGIEVWQETGGAVMRKPVGGATRWVTRERPKIDRIACPWFVARFVDPGAEFLYVPASEVARTAAERDAIAYDVPDVHFSHDGERCSFDAFVTTFRLGGDPALERLATIVRGADTGKPGLTPQSAGLLAISQGLSRLFADDHEMLRHGMVMYDALYRWCREGQSEAHAWNPAAGWRP